MRDAFRSYQFLKRRKSIFYKTMDCSYDNSKLGREKLIKNKQALQKYFKGPFFIWCY